MAVENEDASKGARGKVVLVAQEIAFAKILAGNNKTLRDRGVKRLSSWLKARSSGTCDFTDDDFMRIWKGLFYCMWMADKPLVQEELAEKISRLIHCFNKTDLAIMFIQCFYDTMVTEWYSIDQLRYDKFLMLVRRFLRQTFEFCRKCGWNAHVIQRVCNGFSTTILSTSASVTSSQPGSLIMHFCDIYLQELSKVSQGKLPVDMLTAFLQPFICYLAEEENGRLRNMVENDVFHYLMKQSDAGIELEESRRAWSAAGCSSGSWEDVEKVNEADSDVASEALDSDVSAEMSDSETVEDGPLDPRAGLVDVELPQLKFDSQGIADTLWEQSQKCVRKKNRNSLQSLAEKFKKMAEIFPQAVIERLMKSEPKIERFRLKNKRINKAALQLTNYEKNEGRRRRKRKRHGQKKFDKESTTKNDDAVATNSLNKVVLQAAEKSENTNTDLIQATEVSSDPVMTNECFIQETADIRVTENNSEDGQKNRKEIEENSSNDSVAVPCLKRKSDLLLTEFENMGMGLQQVKVQRKESHKALNVEKDEKSEMSKKKSAEGIWRYSLSNLTSKSSTPGSRMSVGGDWKVSDVPETNLKSDSEVKAVTPSSGKKVNIALNRNSAQGVREYHMSVIRSPAIPFDASKKPGQGVLKPCPVGSRINPFYKLNKRKKLNS